MMGEPMLADMTTDIATAQQRLVTVISHLVELGASSDNAGRLVGHVLASASDSLETTLRDLETLV